jgi:hypothetical protein
VHNVSTGLLRPGVSELEFIWTMSVNTRLLKNKDVNRKTSASFDHNFRSSSGPSLVFWRNHFFLLSMIADQYIVRVMNRNIYERVAELDKAVINGGTTIDVSCDSQDVVIGGFCVAQGETIPLGQLNISGARLDCVYLTSTVSKPTVKLNVRAVCLRKPNT